MKERKYRILALPEMCFEVPGVSMPLPDVTEGGVESLGFVVNGGEELRSR